MKKQINPIPRFVVMFALALLVGPSAVPAQSREQYVISAKAGGVNFVAGDVTVKRPGSATLQTLTSSDNLQDRDVVNTSANGRVEVLLSPGSYFRAAENSEFELTDGSLDRLRLRLIRGSAVVEVAGADGARMLLEIATPQTRIVMDRKGLYRINCVPESATELLVRKGQAMVGSNSSSAIKVKDGHQITVRNRGEVVTAKFDKKETDSFDLWSERRGKELADASRKLPDRALASSFDNYRRSGFWGQRGYRSLSGLWIYDPFIAGRTFLPFYHGWSSPYGRHYSTGFGFSSHRHSLFGFSLGRAARHGHIVHSRPVVIHRHRTHRHGRH